MTTTRLYKIFKVRNLNRRNLADTRDVMVVELGREEVNVYQSLQEDT